MTKLYTDTSANLPLALLREVRYPRHSVFLHGQRRGGGLQRETDFDGKAFYDAMRRGAEVKTSMVNPATAAAFFERARAGRRCALRRHVRRHQRHGTHACARGGGAAGKISCAKIMTIDPYAASLGEGLQVLEAAELLRAGRSLEEVGDRILTPPPMCQFFTVDDLNYLQARRAHLRRGGAGRLGARHQAHPARRRDGPHRFLRQGARE